MKIRLWKHLMMIIAAVIMTVTYAGFVFAAVTPEEAAQLGKNLTFIGAEKAGNKEGTIPAYTGGGIAAPKSYVAGSGIRPNPFPNDKILFVINAQNVEQYKEKLPASLYGAIKRHPKTFFLNVYQTRRTARFPEYIMKETVAKVGKARNIDGMILENIRMAIPFPIPKDAREIMWNKMIQWTGVSMTHPTQTYICDENGRITLASDGVMNIESPYYSKNPSERDMDAAFHSKQRFFYYGPERSKGQMVHFFWSLDMRKGMICYQYLPGQRRVKLAPEISHDQPNSAVAGYTVADESNGFNGSMERYDWKLLGKKEMYVPYNNYGMYDNVPIPEIMKLGHPAMDKGRYELHRVYVVEATLKPGKRHLYARRILYIDEDTWQSVTAAQYDNRGSLYRVSTSAMNYLYEKDFDDADGGFYGYGGGTIDLLYGRYTYTHMMSHDGKYGARRCPPESDRFWTPQGLAGKGVR